MYTHTHTRHTRVYIIRVLCTLREISSSAGPRVYRSTDTCCVIDRRFIFYGTRRTHGPNYRIAARACRRTTTKTVQTPRSSAADLHVRYRRRCPESAGADVRIRPEIRFDRETRAGFCFDALRVFSIFAIQNER